MKPNATRRGWLLAALALVCATAALAADPTPEQVNADIDKLIELSGKYAEQLGAFTGGAMVHETTEEGMIGKAEKLLSNLAEVEKEAVPAVQPVLAQIVERYGAAQDPADTNWEIKTENAVDTRFWELKAARRDDGSRAFSRLFKGLNSIGRTRRASATYLVDYVKAMPAITFYTPDVRVKQAEKWKALLGFAVKLDPNSAEAHAQAALIDQVVATAVRSIEQEADATVWPGHVAEFGGPGSTSQLAKAALDYFAAEKTWGGSERKITVLAVAVRGEWKVAETNVFGQVTQWRLPIVLAITTPDYKAKNMARIYELSVLAKLGAPGTAPKAPPFEGFWVGNSKMIRPAKLPHG
ncbi:MAG: hypothetical protein HZB16_08015 [Armatimonadetes bacterium]|nr:hypothetical protein [Armatimonadota bacterium]